MKNSIFRSLFLALSLMLATHLTHAQCATVYDTITPTICNGDTFFFNGIPHTRSTTIGGIRTYSDTAALAGGCDSITFLKLTVIRAAKDSFTQLICSGNSYNFNGAILTTSGVYKDTLINGSALGCDSITTVNLIVGGAVSYNIVSRICYGDSTLFNGTYYRTPGVYYDTVVGGVACDSIVVLTLSYIAMPVTTLIQSYCQGTSYPFNGTTLSAPGTYYDTIYGGAQTGCDSIVRLNLYPTVVKINVHDTICYADTLPIAGGFYILGSNGSARYAPDTVAYSCADSIYTYYITVDTPATPTLSALGLVLTETLSGFVSYQWQLAGGDIPGAMAQSYTATASGSYTVIAGDVRGCSAASAPYTLTTSGVEGISGDHISVYPNPNTGSFILGTTEAIGSSAQIYDVLGNLVTQTTVTKDNLNISLNLPGGIYLLRVKTHGGDITSIKFVISK